MSNNRSVETIKAIFAIDISEAQQDELIRHEGGTITDKDRWVSEVRIIELISSLYIDKTKIEYFFDENTFFIRINGDSRKLFYIELNKLHSSHQIDSKKYQGYFYSKIESEEQLTCNLEQRINLINSGKIKNSDGSIKSYREREFELLNLRKELVYIKENGKEIIDIFNKTNETLRRDYGVRKDEIPLYGRVRSLSFVDIYEKRLWRFYDR